MRILEIDGERRRLSLSLKRVEEGDQPVPRADGAESVHTMPDLRLSEEAFPTSPAAELDVGRGRGARGREASRRAEAEEIAEEVVAEVELEEADAEAEIAEEIVAEVELDEVERRRPSPRQRPRPRQVRRTSPRSKSLPSSPTRTNPHAS